MIKKTGLLKISVAMGLALAPVTSANAEIVIGIAGPMTGGASFLGEQQDIGANRAIADLNDAGGVLGQDVSSVIVDDACDPVQATATAQQLVASDVVFVNGHLCSSASIKASETYDAAGIPMMSPASTNPTVTDRGLAGVFRVIGRDDDQALVAADLIEANFKDSRIAILNDGGTYGRGLAEGVKEALNTRGITEVLFNDFAAEQDSYSDVVSQLVDQQIEVIYIVGNGLSDIALLTLQAKENLQDVAIVSSDILAGDDFMLTAGEAGEGAFFTFGPDPRLLPSAAEVVSAIRDEEAYEPSGFTLYSYAAIQVWAAAVEAAGTTDSTAVIAALKSEEFDTIIGKIGFNEKGDVTGINNFVVYQWGEDAYVQVE